MTEYKLYIDANVFVSYIRQEVGGGFEQLGEKSKQFFAVCAISKIPAILSDLFFKEVKGATGLERQDVIDTLNEFGLKMEIIGGDYTENELLVFRKLGLHRADAIHAHLTLASGADCIITWNKAHFENASALIKALRPSEFTDNVS